MAAKVLDFYRAKAKQIVNRSFERCGTLPGGCVHDLIYVHVHNQRQTLAYWKDILNDSVSETLNEIARSAVAECERLIVALEILEQEYKLHHNNDLEYTCI